MARFALPFIFVAAVAAQSPASIEGSVAGRVLDPDSHPVAGVQVSVRRERLENGRPVQLSYSGTETDGRGEYRIAGLHRGHYILEADAPPLGVSQPPSRDPRPPAKGVARTYLGGTLSAVGATPLTLTAGLQIEGLDLTLVRADTFCVTSSMTGLARAPVFISELMPWSRSRIAQGTVASGGEFEICGLPDGNYRLWSAIEEPKSLYASESFTIAGRSLKLPRLTLAAPLTQRGNMAIAGDRFAPIPDGVTIRLSAADRMEMATEAPPVLVGAAGDFSVPWLMRDDYWVDVAGLPAGYYVKSATVNGRDAFRQPLRAGSGNLDVLLATDGATLSAKVAAANALVLLFGADFTRRAYLGRDGTYIFASLPPGEYRMAAFTDRAAEDRDDAEFLREQAFHATAVRLGPGQRKSVDLEAVKP